MPLLTFWRLARQRQPDLRGPRVATHDKSIHRNRSRTCLVCSSVYSSWCCVQKFVTRIVVKCTVVSRNRKSSSGTNITSTLSGNIYTRTDRALLQWRHRSIYSREECGSHNNSWHTGKAVLVSFAMYTVRYAGMLWLLSQTMPINKCRTIAPYKQKKRPMQPKTPKVHLFLSKKRTTTSNRKDDKMLFYAFQCMILCLHRSIKSLCATRLGSCIPPAACI